MIRYGRASQRRKQECLQGYVLLWLLVIIGLILLLFMAFGYHEPPDRWYEKPIVRLCAAGVILCLIVEALRDFYIFCEAMLVICGVAGIVSGVIAWRNWRPSEPPVTAIAVSIGTFLGALGALLYILRNQSDRRSLPNVLRLRFETSHIFEAKGVQLVLDPIWQSVSPGQTGDIHVYLQNCWNAERTITLEIQGKGGVLPSGDGLLYPSETSVTLGGAVVGSLSIPFRAESGAQGNYSLLLIARVEGSGGARVRKRRERAYPSGLPVWFQLLGMAAALVAPVIGMTYLLGRGEKVQISVQGEPVHEERDPEIPPPSWAVLWEPGQEESQVPGDSE